MKKILMSVLLAGLCNGANAAIINFDHLTEPGSYGPNTTYGFVDSGFQFSANMDAIDVSPTGGWWSDGVGSGHSGQFAAVNNYLGDMVMTKLGGGTFSVASIWLNGWQGDNTNSIVTGLLNGNVVQSITASYSNPWKQFDLNFTNIDTLFISGGNFLVDDLNIVEPITKVPEPSSILLMGLGLIGLGLSRRVAR